MIFDPTTVARPEPCRFGGPLWQELALNERWIAQPKLNGWRCILVQEADSVKYYTRHGKRIRASGGIRGVPTVMVEDTVIDGELLGGEYYPFDVMFIDGEDITRQSLERRLYSLAKLYNRDNPYSVTRCEANNKGELYQQCLQQGHEGVVLKCLDGQYPPLGGAKWLKVKP